ncbi:MAG: TfoX/Sxy family protein [Pseudomonadota bacterium]
MSLDAADLAHGVELFSNLGTITTRKMMGGACLYANGTIFAIIHPDGGLMLKAQGDMIERMRDLGQTQWTYERDGTTRAMPYWSMPDSALDDPDEACNLAREALSHLE